MWKQVSNFRNRKLRFIQALTRNLYFKNLDNNAGVFLRLINDAEEEEAKEAILAYCFLTISAKAMTSAELDSEIESWFVERWQTSIDFEVDDALQKLIRLQLVVPVDDKYSAVELEQALKRLDAQWDNYFMSA